MRRLPSSPRRQLLVVAPLALGAGLMIGRGMKDHPAAAAPAAVVVTTRPADSAFVADYLVPAADTVVLRGSRVQMERGLAARSAGRKEQAAAAFIEASDSDPRPLGDWALVLAAETVAGSGDEQAVSALLRLVPEDLRRMRGWRAIAAAREAGGDFHRAADAALQALPDLPSAADSASAWATAGKNLLSAKERSAARRFLVEAIRADPRGRGAALAADLLRALDARTQLESWALASQALAVGKLSAARHDLASLPWDKEPWRDRRAALELEYVASLLRQQRNDEAERAALIAADRVGVKSSRAAFQVLAGRARVRLGHADAAQSALEEAVRLDPKGPAAQEALYLLGDLDDDGGLTSEAIAHFARAFAVDSASQWGGESAMRLGLILFGEGRYQDALGVFQEYRRAAGESWRVQQATYWAGRSAEAIGDRSGAEERFREVGQANPVGYYAMRASVRLGPEGWSGALPSGPSHDARVDAAAQGAVGRIRALEGLDLPEAAELERRRVTRALSSLPGGLHALAEAYHGSGRHREGVVTARSVQRTAGGDARLLRSLYPLPFRSAIERSAKEMEIDPALVAALIRQESLFQPAAVSPVGAVGLMQLMPATARALAPRARLGASAATRLRDPAVNVRLGTMHLKDLLESRSGRVDQVLAAYNAGGTRLQRWMRLTDPSDSDQLLERIPYRETREYMRTVMESRAIYADLYWPGANR